MDNYKELAQLVRNAAGKAQITLMQGIVRKVSGLTCEVEIGGIADMLMDNDPLYWRTLIREQMEMDRQRVNSIRITPKGIEIDATY